MMQLQHAKDIAFRAAMESGQILLNKKNKIEHVHWKSSRELVLDVDLLSEKKILEIISGEFPDHSLYSEEKGQIDKDSDYLWIIDPLDGTHNYFFGVPFFGVSIALSYKQNVVLGVVYLPAFDELFHAEVGKGAYLNGAPIHPSEKDNLLDSMILFDNQFYKMDNMTSNFANLAKSVFTVRILGSAVSDICTVARGKAEARILHKAELYDVAATVLILREAGGKVSDFNDNPWKFGDKEIIASNEKIHKQIIEIFSKHIK